ncbi:MAG TPA: hypothetical protein VKU80_06470 [Planctomycetota bacterium]|nr:hypothetical protein [Planctomycetota bacterium]
MESTVTPKPAGQAAPEDPPEESLLGDLALILSEDRATYLRLGPDTAVLTVKSPETFAFGETVDCNWVRMTPEARARTVVGWIRRAAEYYRSPKVKFALQRGVVA